MTKLKSLFSSINEGWKRVIVIGFVIHLIIVVCYYINNINHFGRSKEWSAETNDYIVYFDFYRFLTGFFIVLITLFVYWAIIFSFLWIREGFQKKTSKPN